MRLLSLFKKQPENPRVLCDTEIPGDWEKREQSFELTRRAALAMQPHEANASSKPMLSNVTPLRATLNFYERYGQRHPGVPA